MKICVQGLWHLGSVTAACLASVGYDVSGFDPDINVIANLAKGKAPLFEPGLDELLLEGVIDSKLEFHTSPEAALVGAAVLWVTFDTPVDEDDQADVDFVQNQIQQALPYLDDGSIVLVSSQMPVGSIQRLEEFARQHLPNKKISFACSPENLRLGKALEVFLNPDRIVVGVRNELDREILQSMLSRITNKIEWMSVESAEMTKHAINAFLATSVTFANEIAAICELVGADAKEVERGLKTEMRIGPKAYLSPGGPFAGGTLARDINFLEIQSKAHNLENPLLSAVRHSNQEHKKWVRRKILQHFEEVKDITVGVWGLTYKPGTNTLRRSMAVELCDWLIDQGVSVKAFDPEVKQIPERWKGKIEHCKTALEAIENADVLIVGTEWPEFRVSAESLVTHGKKRLVIIDANRHLYPVTSKFTNTDFIYLAVGTAIKG